MPKKSKRALVLSELNRAKNYEREEKRKLEAELERVNSEVLKYELNIVK